MSTIARATVLRSSDTDLRLERDDSGEWFLMLRDRMLVNLGKDLSAAIELLQEAQSMAEPTL